MAAFDAVLVGSGINTLTAAALLARDGWTVCVLERSDRLGGAIRTEVDYTLPGFTHEVLSSWHPLVHGSAAYAELGDELHRRGLEYVNTELPTGTAFPDGSAMFLSTRTSPSSTASPRVTAPPGSGSSRSSWRTPT
jgi:phytoene dehydrogenase-like protein